MCCLQDKTLTPELWPASMPKLVLIADATIGNLTSHNWTLHDSNKNQATGISLEN